MKVKRTFFLLFCLLAGIIAGALLARLCAGVPVLSWLSFSGSIGFDPVTFDLNVFQFTLGMHMGVSVAQVLTITLAIFVYNRINIK